MSTIVTPEIAQSVTVRDVAVIGSGHAGLTLRASLALLDHQPECTENSLERRAQLAERHVPVAEAGFTELARETTPVRAEEGTSSGTGGVQFSLCADASWRGWIGRPLLRHDRRSGDRSSPSRPARL